MTEHAGLGHSIPMTDLVEQVEADVEGIPDEDVSDCDDGGGELGPGDLGDKADETKRGGGDG